MADKLLIEALERIESFDYRGAVTPNRIAREALARHRSQQEAAEWTIASSWWGQGSQVRMWIVQRGDRQFPFFNISDANYLVGLLNASPAPSESAAKDAARYRWLRGRLTTNTGLSPAARSGGILDDAIDAAMAASDKK